MIPFVALNGWLEGWFLSKHKLKNFRKPTKEIRYNKPLMVDSHSLMCTSYSLQFIMEVSYDYAATCTSCSPQLIVCISDLSL